MIEKIKRLSSFCVLPNWKEKTWVYMLFQYINKKYLEIWNPPTIKSIIIIIIITVVVVHSHLHIFMIRYFCILIFLLFKANLILIALHVYNNREN